jgi:micrococcal nuclease
VSKPWIPRIVPGRRDRAGGRARAGLRELGAMVLIGLAAGIAVALWPRLDSGPAPEGHEPTAANAPAADPWAESRRSRAILQRQEAPPPPAVPREEAVAAPAGRALPAAVRVLDGDTFDHGGVRIRIADIDTPELQGRCAYESELALRAAGRLRTLLAAGPFDLERTGARDIDVHGRKLRVVTRGGRSLGGQMVAEGLARPWRGHREPWCQGDRVLRIWDGHE